MLPQLTLGSGYRINANVGCVDASLISGNSSVNVSCLFHSNFERLSLPMDHRLQFAGGSIQCNVINPLPGEGKSPFAFPESNS
jgi:hypothetical protein